MKTTKFFYGMAAFAAIGMVSCSSEEPIADNGNGIATADGKMYVNLAIRGDLPGTRSSSSNGAPGDDDTDFSPGTEQESEIKEVYFVFYDAAGHPVNTVSKKWSDLQESTVTSPSGTVEQARYDVVEVSYFKGQGMPAKVMCYINPITPAALQSNLSDIQTVTRENVTTGEGSTLTFPMSNAVYFEDSNATEPIVAVDLAGKTFETREEANAALDKIGTDNSGVAEIYVERYASKLTFSFPSEVSDYITKAGTLNGGATAPEVVLSYVIDGWEVNAQAKQTYVVKSFREPGSDGVILPTSFSYGTLNAAINGELTANNAWTWNNPGFHRSYWAISPAYFQADYPEVASDLNDIVVNQNYLSYNDIDNNGKKHDGTTPYYYRETTVGTKALDSDNPAAAVPYITVIGHYTLTVGGTAVPADTDGGVSFYTYDTYANEAGESRPYVYFRNSANSLESAVSGGVSMYRRFLAQTNILYKKVGDQYVRLDVDNNGDAAMLMDALEVKHPSEEVKGEMKLANRQVTLQFKENADVNGIYIANGNGYHLIGDGEGQVSVVLANQLLMNQVGYAVYYNGGKGAFNIPVKHLGWYRAGNEQKDEKGKIDWSKVRVGDFGMVRNHVYNINVTEVTGLAAGVADPATPIIPPADTDETYIAYRVNILKWAVVPSQGVVLE